MSDRSENASSRGDTQGPEEGWIGTSSRNLEEIYKAPSRGKGRERLSSLFSQPHNEQAASTTYLPYYYDIYHSHEYSTYHASAQLLLSPTAEMKCYSHHNLAHDATDRVEQMQDGERQDNVALLYHIKPQQKTVELLSLLWRARDRGRYRQTHQQLSLFCAGASASARRLYRAGRTAQSQASDVCSDLSGCLFLYGEEQRDEGLQ
ncbi:hypothetical protein PROFUN_14711 [Planoprotostelium fungivorum]|uniref:Uncharacterized protein n=1 Tax=Planoprotostelium fungivorum TaxID=1890364 RepID=A0A2P6MZ42_9EUKA|nr:hypothetical protein PROFUN_14711 [Planoprotostelium fungivorum]